MPDVLLEDELSIPRLKSDTLLAVSLAAVVVVAVVVDVVAVVAVGAVDPQVIEVDHPVGELGFAPANGHLHFASSLVKDRWSARLAVDQEVQGSIPATSNFLRKT